MSEKIKKRKRAGNDLLRILLRNVKHAEKSVQDLRDEPEEAIHQLRVTMKKIRALLRLAEDAPGVNVKRDLVPRIRRIKNVFAAWRENGILRKTLERLEADSGLAGQLIPKKQMASPRSEDVIRRLLREIHALEKKIGTLHQNAARNILGKFRKTLKKAAACMRSCRKSPTPENFHEWRKRVKDAWYQNAALGKLGKGRKLDVRASTLSDLLGDAHDLSVLEARVGISQVNGKEELLSKIQGEQNASREKAFRLGRKFL